VKNGFQALLGVGVRKYQLAHLGPIHCTSRVNESITKRFANLRQGFSASLRELVSDQIGIDDART
jgi:hypothetical protein